jgi:flavodoxin
LRKLVVYYSHDGNTRLIAENIAQVIEADILELKPEKEIGSKGFMKFIWGGRQAMMGTKPPLKKFEIDPNEYDIIFIGTPIWAFRQSPPIKTFMEDHLPKKKMMAFFCSYEGNYGKTFENMREWSIGNEVLGEKAFMAPLKQDQIKTIKEARDWALSLMESLS